jgi:NarL family two-component system sensor histidine kinase YdfH
MTEWEKSMAQLPTPAAARQEIRDTWPFFVVVSLVIGAGYVTAMRSVESLREPTRIAVFTALVLLTGSLYWLTPYFVTSKRRMLAFFAIQGAATFCIGLLTTGHWLVMGLYPPLVGIAIGTFWGDLRSVATVVTFCLFLLAVNIVVGPGLDRLLTLLPFIGFNFVFVFVYVVLFVRQVDARTKAQALLEDLESAHSRLRNYAAQVEELTLIHERERMGRELHDTLAQGLAGLIMQLEAADCHLESGDPDHAREVLQQAMQRTRMTLHEARRAIQALRASVLDRQDLEEAISREVDLFVATTSISCRYEVDVDSMDVPPETAQHILRIVQESLSNVTRHSQAHQVEVRLEQMDDNIRVAVHDDGVGFDPAVEHEGFGLAGMQERAAQIGGELQVVSSAGGGTTVELTMLREEA